MTDRTRVSGSGGAAPTTTGTDKAEAGFQQALGQSRVATQPVAKSRQDTTSKTPLARQPAGPQSTPATQRPALASASLAPPLAPPLTRAPARPSAPPVTTPRELPASARDASADGQFSTLSDRLVQLRRTLGVTQMELARRMGSTQPALARLEKGDMKPNLRTLARYGEAIGQRVQVSFSQTQQDRDLIERVTRREDPRSQDDTQGLGDNGSPLEQCSIEQVPETLGQVRRQLGLTQTQVATAMDTSQPVIARLESGEAVPNLRTLERYCEALGVEATISFEALSS